MTFNPDRFLGPNPEPDINIGFVYGRRICPGRHLADTTVYLSIAQSLSVFTISKGINTKTGQGIENKQEFTPGIISHPAPFQSTIKPRSKEAERLVRNIAAVYPPRESDSKLLRELS